MSYKDIVICGSMSFYNEMIYAKKKLNEHGINAILPESDNDFFDSLLSINSKNIIDDYKSSASRIHIKKIWRLTTRAILVVNSKKRSVDNYIGANTLAEIALAFALNKKIYLMYDYSAMYYDELAAWGATPLMGDLSQIISYLSEPRLQQLLLPGINLNERRR